MNKIYSRSQRASSSTTKTRLVSQPQSASLVQGFNSEEEADKWISENKQSDEIYKITDHVTYIKTGSEKDWTVKRNYYYEARI